MTEEQQKAILLAIDYILLAAEHNAIIENKVAAVKKQDFEEASKWRDEENSHKKLMPTYDDLKKVRSQIIGIEPSTH
jgi:hypothetical protein